MTEEARSRFFSPVRMLEFSHDPKTHSDLQVFNHLVKQFTFMFRNNPESIIEGRISTRGSIEYFFKAFGALAILCIEMELETIYLQKRLNTIAQVIAECDGKPDVLEDTFCC
jgi:hypothetical protein